MPPVGSGALPLPYAHVAQPRREPRQPMRTSKLGNKLKVLPTQPDAIPEEDGEADDAHERSAGEGEGVEFYTPLSQIPAGSARRDAQKLTKSEKAKLPRVTAYCTAASYNLPALQAYLAARPASYRTHPRLFDSDCLHTPYLPPLITPSAHSLPRSPPKYQIPEGQLVDLTPEEAEPKRRPGFRKRPGGSGSGSRSRGSSTGDARREPQREAHLRDHGDGHGNGNGDGEGHGHDEGEGEAQRVGKAATAEDGVDSEDEGWEEEEWVPDVFLFEYGTIVLWGMTEKEERAFLRSLKKFEVERLSAEDVEMEDLNFYYADYSRTKLSLSHALSQSVKISLFEELISATIEQTKDIPKSLSETGKVGLPRSEIMKQIGNLFILRININLVGSILDSPEFFWTFPDLEPLYNAARSYLEISQRIDLLNARVDVLQDMLKLLKESVNSSHGERLEAIVIVLIAIEIVLGIVTILVDLSLS
ncbi:sporulation protein rmd1 [Cryptotrichosporon argae]